VLFAGVLVHACSDDSSSNTISAEDLARADRGFVGTVDGTNAFVALLSGGGEAVVYVCDGDTDIAEWFSGPADGTEVDLTNDRGARVEANLTGTTYTGTVTLATGARHTFSAIPTASPGGLLRVTGDEARADGVIGGWIVASDGQQRGSLTVRGLARPARPVPGDSLDLDGKRYPVSVLLIPPRTPATPPGVPIPYPNTGIVAAPTG
jgi:hypothetical protein